ncbi:MAG: hypothetical protein ACI8WT_003655 [Clostridium sp.]|jgi:hypothetical protein
METVLDRPEMLNLDKKSDSIFSENQMAVVQAFVTNEVDESHYSGEKSGCIFSALAYDIYKIPIINENNIEQTEGNIQIYLEILRNLQVKPTHVVITDNGIKIEWEVKDFHVLNSSLVYFKIALEFASFIDLFDFSKLELNICTFSEFLEGHGV